MKRKTMKRHKVTRKLKSGKTVTYWRGKGLGTSKVKGVRGKGSNNADRTPGDPTREEWIGEQHRHEREFDKFQKAYIKASEEGNKMASQYKDAANKAKLQANEAKKRAHSSKIGKGTLAGAHNKYLDDKKAR